MFSVLSNQLFPHGRFLILKWIPVNAGNNLMCCAGVDPWGGGVVGVVDFFLPKVSYNSIYLLKQ